MAVTSNLVLDQGSDFTVSINYNNEDGSSKDLTNYTSRSQMRKSYYSTTATTITANISNASNGEITLSLSSNVTANIKSGRYVYDLEVVSNTGYVTRVIEGIITVLPEVTR
jgi:hypothetical protein